MSVVTRTNRATNPNVGTAATNYSAVPGTGGTATGARNAGAGNDGKLGFYRVSWTVATTAISGGASYLQTGLSASTQYTHSIYVRSSKTQTVTLAAQYQNSSSVNVGSLNTGTAVALTANIWALASVTATSGALVDRVVLTAQAATGGALWANGDTLDVDTLLIETAATVGAFFDGSYTDTSGIDYAWTGTADASTSTATQYSPVLTLTALSDAPTDRVQIQITDMIPQTCQVTVWRTADGKRAPVRSYRKVNVIGSDSTVDFEAPLGRLTQYDLEVLSGPGYGGPAASASITVTATSGWIQDPLDPSTAIRLQATDTGSTGSVTLKDAALKSLEMAASINLVEIIGSPDPVGLLGNRMALKGLSFAMMTNAANSAALLRTLIKQTPLLLIRPLPAWAASLPGLCYTAAPMPTEIPINEAWGGTATEWKFDTALIAAPTMNVIIPLWTYGDWQALWTTYQNAQTTLSGKTYLQVKQRPATG